MSENSEPQRVLAIFAHPDDELGCAGTMANHVEAGDKVTLAFLTKGENSTPVPGDPDEIRSARKKHTEKIEDLIGVKVHFMDFPDSKIEYNMENAYKVAELIKEIRPHIIITWNRFERMGSGHPDHRNTASLVYDALNYARYKNNSSDFEPYRDPVSFYRHVNPDEVNNKQRVYIEVSHQLDKIKQFIEIYKEAYGKFPVEDFKNSFMRLNGYSSGVQYAETFEVVSRRKSALMLLD